MDATHSCHVYAFATPRHRPPPIQNPATTHPKPGHLPPKTHASLPSKPRLTRTWLLATRRCGYSIEQQVALFESIKPLFQGKPLVVAVNKVDVRTPEQLSPAEQAQLQKLRDSGAKVVFMSTLQESGLLDVKNAACDLLLAQVRHAV